MVFSFQYCFNVGSELYNYRKMLSRRNSYKQISLLPLMPKAVQGTSELIDTSLVIEHQSPTSLQLLSSPRLAVVYKRCDQLRHREGSNKHFHACLGKISTNVFIPIFPSTPRPTQGRR